MKKYIKKIGFALILSLLFSLTLPFCGAFADYPTARITIVHTNDTHARVLENANEGMGFSKIATKVNQLRKENPNLLLIDAGDTLHGLPIATISRGEGIVKILNAMKYDVIVPGNHDFNYGRERLLELAEEMDFPMIAANIYKDGKLLFAPYILRDVAGIKLAVLGLSTPETAYKTNPKNVEGIEFKDPVAQAADIVKELEGKADYIIALCHLGIDADSAYTSRKVAENVPGIDLIIDGHSHSTLPAGEKSGNTLIVQTGSHAMNLGIVEIEFQGDAVTTKARLFTKEDAKDLPHDPDIDTLTGKIQEENMPFTSVKVGETAIRLDGEREHVRSKESNLGNLVADAIRKAAKADMSIVNGGQIRTSVEPGDITAGDIISVLPFGNYSVLKEISGADILAALEHGTSSYPEPKGGFPQVSGATFSIDLNKGKGHRISDVRIGGEPLNPDKLYKLAINNFLSEGGDDYTMFIDTKTLEEHASLDEIVMDYIRASSPIDIKEEGRIGVTEQKSPQSDHTPITHTVKPGQVLWRIAEGFGLTWQRLAQYNNFKNPHLIFPGQKILIPAY